MNCVKFSDQQLVSMRQFCIKVFSEYHGYMNRCHIPFDTDVNLSEKEDLFIGQFYRELSITAQTIDNLNKEFYRRTKLVNRL